MRYFINSKNCTYDAATGNFTILLDRQISNPVDVSLIQVLFKAGIVSASTVYPPCVYFHSDALNRMIKTKHAVELLPENHENPCNIIAVLDGTHLDGRYHLRYPQHYNICYRVERSLDFRFSDNGTTMAAGAGTTTTTTTTSSVDYTEVEDNLALPSGQTKTGRIFRCYDTGGAAGQYGNNENLNRVFVNSDNHNWKMTILNYQSENSYDKLTIVAVADDLSETVLLNQYSGSTPPNPADYTAASKTVRFEWITDSSNTQLGFDIILWGDDNGNNTLSEAAGVYSVAVATTTTTTTTTPAAGNEFVVELDIIPSH